MGPVEFQPLNLLVFQQISPPSNQVDSPRLNLLDSQVVNRLEIQAYSQHLHRLRDLPISRRYLLLMILVANQLLNLLRDHLFAHHRIQRSIRLHNLRRDHTLNLPSSQQFNRLGIQQNNHLPILAGSRVSIHHAFPAHSHQSYQHRNHLVTL